MTAVAPERLDLSRLITSRAAFAAEVATNPLLCSGLMNLVQLALNAEMHPELRLGSASIELAMIARELRLRAGEVW